MTIQEIKEKLSIEAVLRHYGISVGSNGHINCPFHEDKTPSMRVYKETNTVYCFSGNCATHGKSLDVIDFIMKKEACTKHEALLKAKKMLGYEGKKKAEKPSIYNNLWSYFKSSYNRSNKAKDYLKSRGLEGIESGLNNGSWHRSKLPEEMLKAGEQIGFLRPSLGARGYSIWAKDCIIFPLKGVDNRVCSFYGRSQTKGHYYLTGRSGLYPCYPAQSASQVILCESVIDAASLLQMKSITDNYSVLALFGTNGFTKEHEKALKSLKSLEKVVLMLDGDEAGQQASTKLVAQLSKLLPKVNIQNIVLPKDMDVNEIWSNHQSEAPFLELLAAAETKQEAAVKQPSHNLKIVNKGYLIREEETLKIEVLAGIDLTVLDSLRATLRVTRKPKRNALDVLRQSLDLYHSGQLGSLIKKLHEQLELPISTIRLSLAELIESLEAYRDQERSKLEGKSIKKRILNSQSKAKATAYLQNKKLMQQTWEDLGKIGVVGEKVNAFVMFLCFCSRKLKEPLHVISLGSSGSGKTHLQEVIAELIPKNEVVNVTSLSDNALYYYGVKELQNKVLLLEDMDGTSEDAQFALRELSSKGILQKDVPTKDNKGKFKTIKVRVEGPICFAGCTTQEKVYEDNANRCLLLYRDESKKHKLAVMEQQRRAAAGKINEQNLFKLKEQFKDCQILLKPIKIVNPYAEYLILPNKVFKPLRSNAHYLKFIEVITYYHQLQRTVKTSQSGTKYIETTLEDIEWANKLLKEVLLRKSDELSWGVRAFLERLKRWLIKEKKESFESKEIRQALRIAPSTLKKYLYELRSYGLVKILGGSKYRGFDYALASKDDYSILTNELETALDKALAKLKELKKSG